ncbi:MAG: hypothetical protein ACI8Y4_002439 [Candidatus Poriferisodalaceae bacterium]|jgi:hypothetical protein
MIISETASAKPPLETEATRAHQRKVRNRKIRQFFGILGFFGVIIVIAGALAYARGGPSGYREPSAEDLARLTEVDQAEASPRRDVASALDDRRDSSFPEPLVSPSLIRSGGPPPDGIPAINRPFFETPDQIDWLEDQEPVIVLEMARSDGSIDARAYPVQVLTWHEIVNDTVAGVPVVVSYCPLCNSAIAFERRLPDGDVLDFGTSGSLLYSTMVMFDRQTESLWAHFTGQAIIGNLTGTSLPLLPVATISYADFVSTHPDGLVLSRTTGYGRQYGDNPYPGYDNVSSPPFLLDVEVEGPLLAKTRVVAVRLDGESVVVPHDELTEVGVASFDVAGQAVVAVLSPGTASSLDARSIAGGRDVGATGVFLDVAPDGSPLELAPASGRAGVFLSGDGTGWNVLGVAVSGPFEGERLTAVEHVDTFWFAIVTFEPDTTIVQP